jgi:hypothetical protein
LICRISREIASRLFRLKRRQCRVDCEANVPLNRLTRDKHQRRVTRLESDKPGLKSNRAGKKTFEPICSSRISQNATRASHDMRAGQCVTVWVEDSPYDDGRGGWFLRNTTQATNEE